MSEHYDPYRGIPDDITTQCADCDDQQGHPRHWTSPMWQTAPKYLTVLGRMLWHTPFKRLFPGALGLPYPIKPPGANTMSGERPDISMAEQAAEVLEKADQFITDHHPDAEMHLRLGEMVTMIRTSKRRPGTGFDSWNSIVVQRDAAEQRVKDLELEWAAGEQARLQLARELLAAEATVDRLRCGLDEIDAQLHGGGRSAARMIIESLRPLATPTEDEGSVAT